MTRQFECLLFDADNTLFDFDQAQSQSLRETINQVHGSFDERWHDIYTNISVACWRQYEAGEISVDELKVRRFNLFVQATELKCKPDELNSVYTVSYTHLTLPTNREV